MKKIFSLALTIIFLVASVGCVFAAKDKPEKVKFNKKMLKETELVESAERDDPIISFGEVADEVTILGEAVATPGQMVNFIKKRNPYPKINCSVEELVGYYYEEATREGIRPDVAICQAILETGTWNYGGDVSPDQNNFCGLGATGNKEPGASFATPQMGVRAHIQHLLSYASQTPPKIAVVDPRYELIAKFRPHIFGKIRHWTGLNGVWAVPGNQYGQTILRFWKQAQNPDASEESLEYAHEQVKKNLNDAEVYVYRGIVYYEQENFWGAQADFKKALEIDPNHADATFNLALTETKLKKIDKAIATYDKYLKLYPQSDTGYYNRGLLKLRKKNFKEAIKDFQRTLEIQDRFADAQNEIAVAHFMQKKYNDAWNDIKIAAEINTTNEVINTNKAKLEACIKKKK